MKLTHELIEKNIGWMIVLTIVIGAVLFTSLFTNLYGLATATFATDGTLLYWLGQHDYRRGEQPWFYYLLLMPQYEFIAVLLGLPAALVIGLRTLLVGVRRTEPGPRFFFQLGREWDASATIDYNVYHALAPGQRFGVIARRAAGSITSRTPSTREKKCCERPISFSTTTSSSKPGRTSTRCSRRSFSTCTSRAAIASKWPTPGRA